MATIKYGKGKTLQPTSARVLRATLDANAQAGRVETPDVRQVEEDSKTLAVSRTVAGQLKVKRIAPKGPKDSAAVNKKNEVRVIIDAPDVLQFFSGRKKKEFSC